MIRQGLTKEDQEAFASAEEELRLERLLCMIARSIERSGRPAVVVYTVDEVADLFAVVIDAATLTLDAAATEARRAARRGRAAE